MITRNEALDLLYAEGCPENVIAHCLAVADETVRIARRISDAGYPIDISLAEAGAVLHDIGRSVSHGMDHAVIGAAIAERRGLDASLVLIIKKHIGAGLSPEEAARFGLPPDDYIPETLEEKVVAHADNLLRGSHRISLKKRLRIMKERGIDKGERKKVKRLAHEIASYESGAGLPSHDGRDV